MNRIAWKWLLPIVQLVFASACHLYGPHEYRVRAQLDRAVNNQEYIVQHYPALAERISKGINFPGLVMDYFFRHYGNAIYDRNTDYTLIWIAPNDLGFFAGIVIFWYWVGQKLGRWQGRSQRVLGSQMMRIIRLACVFVFGILSGAYALQMTASKWHPDREIGAFGIMWSLALIAYFAWGLAQELRHAPRRAADIAQSMR